MYLSDCSNCLTPLSVIKLHLQLLHNSINLIAKPFKMKSEVLEGLKFFEYFAQFLNPFISNFITPTIFTRLINFIREPIKFKSEVLEGLKLFQCFTQCLNSFISNFITTIIITQINRCYKRTLKSQDRYFGGTEAFPMLHSISEFLYQQSIYSYNC